MPAARSALSAQNGPLGGEGVAAAVDTTVCTVDVTSGDAARALAELERHGARIPDLSPVSTVSARSASGTSRHGGTSAGADMPKRAAVAAPMDPSATSGVLGA